MHRLSMMSLILACCTSQAPAKIDSSGVFVTLEGRCGISIPDGYKQIRKSADELAYFIQGDPPGSITIKRGDFSQRVSSYDAQSKNYSRSFRSNGLVMLFRSNIRGSKPIDEASLYSSSFAVLVTGKNAEKIEQLVSSCLTAKE